MKLCSAFFIDCFWGDIARVRESIVRARASSDPTALCELLERRELLVRLSPLHAVVMGTRLMPPSPHEDILLQEVKRTADHVAVAEALLEAGALVGSKDVAGCTPLHLATSYLGNRLSLRIAQVLLRHGALVDAPNRFGCSSIFDPVMAGKDPQVRLLLEAGVDPGVRDVDGITPYSMMNAHLGLKELVSESVGRGRLGAGKTLEGERAVLQKLTKVEYNGRVVSVGPYDADADRYSVSLSDGTVIAVKRVNVIPAALSGASDPTPPPRCGICDEPSKFVCGGCIGAGYCNEEHRKADWKRHKRECKAFRKAHVVSLDIADLLPPGPLAQACDRSVDPSRRMWSLPGMQHLRSEDVPPEAALPGSGSTAAHRAARPGAGASPEPYTIVKVQVPPPNPVHTAKEPSWDILLNDEARSHEFRVPRGLPGAEKLAEVIATVSVDWLNPKCSSELFSPRA